MNNFVEVDYCRKIIIKHGNEHFSIVIHVALPIYCTKISRSLPIRTNVKNQEGRRDISKKSNHIPFPIPETPQFD